MNWVLIQEKNRWHRVTLSQTSNGIWVGWSGHSTIRVISSSTSTVEQPQQKGVCAPMTGRIVQVKVAVGDTVKPCDLLVVMEAMKMEYRLTAPRDAEVQAIFCKEGDLVDLGMPLVSLGL